MSILDNITTKSGIVKSGIIDFATKKHIYFFDINPELDLDYTILAILWKGNSNTLRFSVYCSIYYPSIRLPNSILIPIKDIENFDINISNYNKKPKHKKTILKL